MNPPANWYPDPTGRHGQRYWDGAQWTEHVFTDGVQGVDPLEDGGGSAQGGDDEDHSASADGLQDDGTATEGTATVSGDEAAEGTDTTDPAPLPRRRPEGTATDPATTEQADSPLDGVEGLFSTPRDSDVQVAAAAADDAPATETWTPDASNEPGSDEDAVAPQVEPEDVVASVDEVADATPPDFSDAFVLAPETASRLVARRAGPPDAAAPTEPTEEDVEDVVETSSTSDGRDESSDGQGESSDQDTTHDDPEEAGDSEPGPAVDAPPPTTPALASTGRQSLGITGDLVGGAFAERASDDPVALQNARMLRCAAGGGIVARQGTMVAYQGDVHFERQGAGGVGRALKRAATGEGLAMMRVTGTGDVFFADTAQHVFLLELAGGPGLSVNGRNVLAFSASLQWDIERVRGASLLAGGLFNTTLTGSGWVALVSDGEPVVLRTDEAPTRVDVNALVAWSAGLSTEVVNTATAKSLVGLGSGEAFQMAFDGAGIVIVQPSEGPMRSAATS